VAQVDTHRAVDVEIGHRVSAWRTTGGVTGGGRNQTSLSAVNDQQESKGCRLTLLRQPPGHASLHDGCRNPSANPPVRGTHAS
jgi:hypothetical protein